MLVRGLLWQATRLRFGCLVLKGRGARLWVDRRVTLRGIVKVGDFAKLDLRYCAGGSLGPGFSLGDFCVLRASGNPSFTCPKVISGANVSFGPYCNIGGGYGLEIGDNVIAGPYVSIHPEEHGLAPGIPVRSQPLHGQGIALGADCWLGAKSTILDGSRLAEGTVLAAGAMAVKLTSEPGGIYAGIPARLLRSRPPASDGGVQ